MSPDVIMLGARLRFALISLRFKDPILRLSPAAHSRSAHSFAREASRFSRRDAATKFLHYGKSTRLPAHFEIRRRAELSPNAFCSWNNQRHLYS